MTLFVGMCVDVDAVTMSRLILGWNVLPCWVHRAAHCALLEFVRQLDFISEKWRDKLKTQPGSDSGIWRELWETFLRAEHLEVGLKKCKTRGQIENRKTSLRKIYLMTLLILLYQKLYIVLKCNNMEKFSFASWPPAKTTTSTTQDV